MTKEHVKRMLSTRTYISPESNFWGSSEDAEQELIIMKYFTEVLNYDWEQDEKMQGIERLDPEQIAKLFLDRLNELTA